MMDHKNKANDLAIAVFITPHGFGHAARASAVMLELHQMVPELIFHIYTQVPEWFFIESQLTGFIYHDTLTDIGLAQRNAMEEDLPKTIARLSEFLPFDPKWIQTLATEIQLAGCRLVLCDIAPLGIAVARQAGIPSVLEENFTWDWIYAGYPGFHDQFKPHIHILKDWFSKADFHFQTTPACSVNPNLRLVAPVYRPIRQSRELIRQKLELDQQTDVVLVTMGGIQSQSQNFEGMKTCKDTVFIIPGASPQATRDGNLNKLPHHHGIYHPDLVNACDAVIGKLGYSTLAECYTAGVPFGYIPRRYFPESQALSEFVNSSMTGISISEDEYASGYWLSQLPALLAQPAQKSSRANGASEIASFIRDHLSIG
jgi:hypothetical protein